MPALLEDPQSTLLNVSVSSTTATTLSTLAFLLRADSLSFSALQVLRNAQRCLNASLIDLPTARGPMADALSSLDSAIEELKTLQLPAPGGSSGFLAANQPALRLLSRLPASAPQALLQSIGNLLMSGWLTQLPLPRQSCERLAAISSASLAEPVLNEEHTRSLEALLRRSSQDLLETLTQRIHTQDLVALQFNANFINHLRSDLSSFHPDRQRDANLRQFLHGEALEQAISDQLQRMVAGDSEALLTLLGFSLNLHMSVLRQVPLRSDDTCQGLVFWLDPRTGIGHLDLRPLLRDLGQAIPGCEVASDTLRLLLPDVLARHLSVAAISKPAARCIGDLADAAVSDANALARSRDDANKAQLIRSGPSVAIRQASNRLATAYGFLALHLIDHSDLHYVSLSEEQIWRVRAQVFDAASLGAAVDVGESQAVRVGSARTARADTVREVFADLDEAVEKARVSRRYTLTPLISFHNIYALRVGMFLQFVSGARTSQVASFAASCWFDGALFGYMDDKEAGVSGGRTPIPLTPTVSLQLRLWRRHLESLKSRLIKQLGPRASAAVAHIDAIALRQPVSLLFTLDANGIPVPIRTEQFFVGRAAYLNRDWGRHFFSSGMTELNRPLADIHLFLRHQGGGINPQSLLGVEVLEDRLHRTSMAMDSILRDLKVMPLAGLAGERA